MSDIGNKEIFAKNLLYYIDISGRSQREIAEEIGVSPSTFNEWVKGKKYPRIDKIEKLSNYFGIPKSSLIENKNKNTLDRRELTEGEEAVLNLFRQLTTENQQVVLEWMKIATLKHK